MTATQEPRQQGAAPGGGEETRTITLIQAVTEAIAEEMEQDSRVVLFGDSDFLADVYFEEVGNRQLAQNLFQWAATRDRQLSIEVPTVPDASLHMSGFWLTVIAAAFVIGIPLLLLLFGVARWVVRRRR